ncbi:MAG: hydrogenase expression/formation protein HupK [Pseudomonadota bacterium]
MLDIATYPLRAAPAPALPVDRLILGKPVEEAAALLPRLFNLCREAQGIAARAAFGLPLEDGWQDALRVEIVREHVVKLCLKWPALLSLPAIGLPRDWQRDASALSQALFGPDGALPHDMPSFEAWLRTGHGAGRILCALADVFQPVEAVRTALPTTTPDTVFAAVAQENSVAARRTSHPVLQGIEAHWGRGPLWSATAVAVDLAAYLDDAEPRVSRGSHQAVVTAARGLYGVRAHIEDGTIRAFERITPTDHLLAPGGALQQSLDSLPAEKRALAPLLVSLLDPCFPVSLEQATELTHA